MVNKIFITSISDFEILYSVWSELQKGKDMTAFQSVEWNKLLFQEWRNSVYRRIGSKIVVYQLLYDDSAMLLPVIVQNTNTELKCGFGRKKGIYILGHDSYSDYLNVIYKDWSDSKFAYLIDCIKNDYPSYNIYFNNIREDTAFGKFLSLNYKTIEKTVSVSVRIEKDSENFSKSLSKHTRQNLRTALNRMNKDMIKYEWIEYGKVQNDELLDNLLRIHMLRVKKKNYTKGNLIKKIASIIRTQHVLYREKYNNIVKSSMSSLENSFFLIVRLNGNNVGYIYGLKEESGIIRIMQNCIDERYGYYSPMFRGIYDFLLKCCDTKEVSELDFTRGDEGYKYKFGGKETMLYSFKI